MLFNQIQKIKKLYRDEDCDSIKKLVGAIMAGDIKIKTEANPYDGPTIHRVLGPPH